jgi:hypothetical protein
LTVNLSKNNVSDKEIADWQATQNNVPPLILSEKTKQISGILCQEPKKTHDEVVTQKPENKVKCNAATAIQPLSTSSLGK